MLLDLQFADVDPKWREQKLNGQMFFLAAVDPASAAAIRRSIPEHLSRPRCSRHRPVSGGKQSRRGGALQLKEHPALRKEPEVMSDYLRGLYQDDPANARRYLAEHATEEEVDARWKKRSFA